MLNKKIKPIVLKSKKRKTIVSRTKIKQAVRVVLNKNK